MKNYPVIVRGIKPTSNPEMMQVTFEQKSERPVLGTGNLLNFSMGSGSSKFGSPYQTRVAFFNFSPQRIEELGLKEGGEFPKEYVAKLVVHEFCEGDLIPEEVRSYYDNAEKFVPREWVENVGTPQQRNKKQSPKVIPANGNKPLQVLTKNNKPIYRITHLAVGEMVMADIFLQHDNQVVGTTLLLQEENAGAVTGGDVAV